MCTINKSSLRKKSGNLPNDPRILYANNPHPLSSDADYIYIYRYIIIKSFWWHGAARPSLAILPYHPSLFRGFLDAIQCLQRVDVSSYWSANASVFICRSSQENVAYEFVLTSPAVPNMSCSSYLECQMLGKWSYSSCFVGYCSHALFKTTRNILM